MQTLAKIIRQLFLLAVLTVALVATGFGHRLATADNPELQAYLGAGGELSQLCADADAPGRPAHGDCPACHIVAGADLPPRSSDLRDADLLLVATVIAPQESRAVRQVLDPARGLRAPPLA